MSKVRLVASREYLENLRTKTFWIGILSFPVLLIVAATVPKLLEQAKDVRKYAVIDHSGWLLEAIEERATYDDTLRILRFLNQEAHPGTRAHQSLTPYLRVLEGLVRDATPDELVARAKAMALQQRSMLDGGALEGVLTAEQQTEYLLWFAALTPEQAKRVGGIKRERYARVEAPGPAGDREQALRDALEREELFAYFVIGPDPVDEPRAGHKYVSNNRTDSDLKNWIADLASEEVRARRFRRESIDSEVAQRIQAPLDFAEMQISEAGEESAVAASDVIRQFAPMVFVYLLWISIFTIAQLLLTNTVEEKSNRVVEVLLSSITAMQLMVGKILGIAATGLTTIGAWILCFLVFLKLLPRILDLPADFDLTILVRDPVFLASFAIYFLLGFLLFASILVGMGSACNSIKEAQNLMAPVMLLLILPLLAMFPVSQDPNGTLARVLSFIPPFTPFVMMNRAAGPPQAWEYAATTALLLVSIAAAFWAAARTFRIGILMTGKPPRLAEIGRWIVGSGR